MYLCKYIIKHEADHGSMLGHHLLRWPNVKPSLFQCVLFAVLCMRGDVLVAGRGEGVGSLRVEVLTEPRTGVFCRIRDKPTKPTYSADPLTPITTDCGPRMDGWYGLMWGPTLNQHWTSV